MADRFSEDAESESSAQPTPQSPSSRHADSFSKAKQEDTGASSKRGAPRPPEPGLAAPGRTHVWLWTQARRVVVAVIGTTVLLIGIAMIVLPGPATVVIPCGLAILATEFVWARRWLDYAKHKIRELATRANVITGDGEKPEGDAGNQV